jgi:hypothetical protein
MNISVFFLGIEFKSLKLGFLSERRFRIGFCYVKNLSLKTNPILLNSTKYQEL